MGDQDSSQIETAINEAAHADEGRTVPTSADAGSRSELSGLDSQHAAMYEILQVDPGADVEVMRRVFCFLAEKHHNENPDTAYGMWRTILYAWNTLSNKEVGIRQAEAMPSNHYHTLQVSPRAELGVINEAYHFLLLKYHPDNKTTGDPKKLELISDAWNTLSDTNLRLDYDKTLRT
ncbi:MAG: DnaJ domain-containing protein [Candidatus Obscuribacterales bacterium]|nr:DnaJ domain-containing protein [Candidatus Obscuribacterales bacterium]